MANDVITWQCMGCEDKPQFTDNDQFREHVVQVHGVPRPIQGLRSVAMRLNGPKRYATVYNWKFEGAGHNSFEAIQRIESERTGEDVSLWEATEGPDER